MAVLRSRLTRRCGGVASRPRFTAHVLMAVLSGSFLASDSRGAPPPVDFTLEIRPILSNACFKCHGPDAEQRQGGTVGLRLDTREGALADLGGYAAIVPGRPEESEFLRRVAAGDDEVMPPAEAGGRLSPREVELLTRWVQQGAVYARHWSYVKPRRPPLPPVLDASWPRNAIDRFVLARLEREGLRPSPEADRWALVRRVFLDLTGLPPSIDEAEEFARDPDPGAYERLVDRLLARPAFGEHWATLWLDLARYADSAGYADDPPRTIWSYRDYVIRALNRNTPFDQFTIEQLAGDLLPGATQEQLVATAFHRNTLTNNEGGTNDEEFRNVAVVDRVNTTLAVWMGTTMACAQCHNHKYDPISQEDFFRCFAIFNNTADADHKDESPLLEIHADQQRPGLKPHTTVPVMRELPVSQRRTTHVQHRGNYLDLGPEVAAGLPTALSESDAPQLPDRLALARWLVDDDNPLTPRVVANRYWEAIFGTGIVRTSEDFGSQGELPSHPELLDWLATELLRLRWDTRALLRLLVTSATYRQSSQVGDASWQRDPDNRLLGRGPRVRLSAEMVRDQALLVSGLLSGTMYGPPVKPPQPALGLRAAFGGEIDWQTSSGGDRYRRAVYTTWRRSSPYPSLVTFDATNREVCCLRRIRTNTPLQALVTLNDPVFVEAARALARRILASGGSAVERAEFGFRLCLVRHPRDEELQCLVSLYQDASDRLTADSQAARLLAGQTSPGREPESSSPTVDVAAWTVVANVLLNLDETLMKR